MPPIRNKTPKNLEEQEGRISLAISDLQNRKISNIGQASKIYNVPRSTLRRRLSGIQQRSQTRANGHKLSEFEEESLVKWILDLAKRGLPPRPSMVRDMANILCSQHDNQEISEK
jgi:hypothetical protein